MGEREHLLATAELRLAQRGRAGRLSEVAELSDPERRNLVLRCQLTASHGPASSVILKQARGDYAPDDVNAWDTQRFFRDWVGAAFLSELEGAAHAARLLAGDREHGFIVLEDLGHQPSPLRKLLGGSTEQAVLVLEQWVLRLARMHGQSAGQLARYDELMAGLQGVPASALEPLAYFGQDSAQKLCAFLGEQELRSDELESALHQAVSRLEQPSPFRAFIHGDPCLDNSLARGSELLLIDFEMGRPAHALLDAVYLVAPFPTCTCAGRLPNEVAFSLLELYRQELARFIPAASDVAAFNSAVVDACSGWLVYRLGWLLREACQGESRQWEIGTTRGRILCGLEQYLLLNRQLGSAAILHTFAERLLVQLQQRWPDSAPLQLYPAFRA